MSMAIAIVSYLAGWFFCFISLILWGGNIFKNFEELSNDNEFLVSIFTISFFWPITSILSLFFIVKKLFKLIK